MAARRVIKINKINKRAFTLLEIIISLGILAIGMVGILALYPVGFYASGRAANMIQTATLGTQVLEATKLLDYDDALLLEGSHTESLPGVDWQDARFGYSYKVDIINPTIKLKQITVTVFWTERNASKSETFTTYITKYNP